MVAGQRLSSARDSETLLFGPPPAKGDDTWDVNQARRCASRPSSSGSRWPACSARPTGLEAQALKDLQTPKTPLVLKAQGSFFVGGEKVEQTEVELGSLGPGGHITVNQMYVRYMIPQDGNGVPVVMVHGATLTGKSWETTPDGRMGWDEYFVRKGHPVYVPDQVGRGRSGFNQAVFNDVARGSRAAGQPGRRGCDSPTRTSGRTSASGRKRARRFADSQFPVAAVDELSKQAVPDPNRGLPQPNPTLKALSDLATQLKGAVLMGHSQSGSFPLESALLNVAAVEGPRARRTWHAARPATPPDQIATLAKVPILVVFGDHRENVTGLPTLPIWQERFVACQAMIGRIKGAGGQAEMLAPPDRGIRGNSHMIMQDKNNLQIADLILQWIGAHARKK